MRICQADWNHWPDAPSPAESDPRCWAACAKLGIDASGHRHPATRRRRHRGGTRRVVHWGAQVQGGADPVSYPDGDLRDQLAHVGAEAVRTGLVIGSGGNLSAREPGSDACWVTCSGSWLDRLDRAEFSLLGIRDGDVRDGHPTPSSEWRLHTETYLRRPDITAIVHLHPQTSVLLSALGHGIALMTTDHAYYLREIATVAFDQPGTADLAVAAAEAVADGVNALVLGHHGCSVLADSVELAHKRAFNLEEAARATHAALLLTGGDGHRIPQVPARFLDAVRAGEASA